jgi:hypothetical protein
VSIQIAWRGRSSNPAGELAEGRHLGARAASSAPRRFHFVGCTQRPQRTSVRMFPGPAPYLPCGQFPYCSFDRLRIPGDGQRRRPGGIRDLIVVPGCSALGRGTRCQRPPAETASAQSALFRAPVPQNDGPDSRFECPEDRGKNPNWHPKKTADLQVRWRKGFESSTFCMAIRPTSSPGRQRIRSFAGIS